MSPVFGLTSWAVSRDLQNLLLCKFHSQILCSHHRHTMAVLLIGVKGFRIVCGWLLAYCWRWRSWRWWYFCSSYHQNKLRRWLKWRAWIGRKTIWEAKIMHNHDVRMSGFLYCKWSKAILSVFCLFSRIRSIIRIYNIWNYRVSLLGSSFLDMIPHSV